MVKCLVSNTADPGDLDGLVVGLVGLQWQSFL